jgi:hypothetical protein
LLRFLPAVVELALLVYCLVDCIQTERSRVRTLPKLGWILLIIILPIIGGVAKNSSGSTAYPRRVNHAAIVVASRSRKAKPCGLPMTSTICGQSMSTSPVVVEQDVVGREVAVGPPEIGEREHRDPQPGSNSSASSPASGRLVGQPWGGQAVGCRRTP